jgi:hypothetical protein
LRKPSRRLPCTFQINGLRRILVAEAVKTLAIQQDPHWRELLLFYEYFHGENGTGLGASHQTGWTALVASPIDECRQQLRRGRTSGVSRMVIALIDQLGVIEKHAQLGEHIAGPQRLPDNTERRCAKTNDRRAGHMLPGVLDAKDVGMEP